MVSDRSILETAQGLIRVHGEKAATECSEMAARWTSRGDKEAADIWGRVMQAIRDLEQQRDSASVPASLEG